MGIFASVQRFVSSTFDQGTEVVEAVGKTVSIATTYVDNRATKQTLTDKQRVMLDTAKEMTAIQAELEADDKLAAMFESLKSEFK
ncbi:hypothetical protein HYO98_gp04 [Dinoroseobacter phage DS-1410Ws-06]|uniref:Uncharacterized protein n=1 Tax=Dinoroseobacter phage DS-1410Ws-06 TaxID=1815983 RepID=A0A191VY73_9CAUD|nr:hypothetical protein HYO98_gp04 [Dinoroseobacter phage DS-1410Ws-06]ANJ20661.1 hypothetical protein DSp06_gp04 [Dinoroseobacter phage DS-1410Ws-06]